MKADFFFCRYIFHRGKWIFKILLTFIRRQRRTYVSKPSTRVAWWIFFFNCTHTRAHTRRFIHAFRFTDEQTCNKKVIKTVLGRAVSNEPRPRAFHIPIFWITAIVSEIFLSISSRCFPAKELLHYGKCAVFIMLMQDLWEMEFVKLRARWCSARIYFLRWISDQQT